MFDYNEINAKLGTETAIIIFLKKNGDIRIMLGTKFNPTIVYSGNNQPNPLGWHLAKCNEQSGNIAAFDLVLGEARSFSVKRVLDVRYFGIVASEERLDEVVDEFNTFKAEYEKTKPMNITEDML